MINKIINKIKAFSYFISNSAFQKIENVDLLQIKKKVVFYTLAWGDYLDIYFKHTLPSLLHESNIPSLTKDNFEVSFVLYTLDREKDVKKKYKKELSKALPYSFKIISFEKIKNSDKVSAIANISIVKILNYCIQNQLIMFLAPPDTIFSNNSVFNSVSFSYSKRKSFAAAHPRININFLKDFKKFPEDGFKSTEMVKYAFNNAHQNFKFADEKLRKNTAYAGISYRKLSESLFAITSHMPTTFTVIPTLDDLKFFEKFGSFNDWDRGWLAMLLKKNRLKVCGSSDMFFCVEITKENAVTTNLPKTVEKPWKDLYDKLFSHRICNLFVAIWRI